MKRIIALGSTLAILGAFAINGLAGPASAARSGQLVTGAIGGDFDSQLPSGSINGADWGVDQTLHASERIHDGDVFVVVSTWRSGDPAQTQPTTTDGPGPCGGTLAAPTAPRGVVCVYIAGGDNAADVSGVSIIPGTGGSKLGFKLVWDSSAQNGDTFIDAVWAYRFP